MRWSVTSEACRYLKDYLEERMRELEALAKHTPILLPQKDSHTKKAIDSNFASTNVGDMIRNAIRKAVFSI